MLGKSNRLPASIRLVSPMTISHDLFSLRFVKTAGETSRAAIVVSKKIDKSAVGRNRMRRLLQQFLQEHWDNIATPSDILILVRSPFSELSVDTKNELLNLFVKKGLFSE